MNTERRAYSDAKQRCTNRKNGGWPLYGGRGIKFLFGSFAEFYRHLGPKPTPKHTLDRFPDTNGNYEIGNVRWATIGQQLANRRPHKLRRPDVDSRELVRLYKAFWTVPQLVIRFKMSQHSIEKRLKNAGVQLRGRYGRNLRKG